MNTKHTAPHPFSGKTMRIKKEVKHFQYPSFGGSEIRLEDWWDRVSGESWMNCEGNPGCLVYAMRSTSAGLPMDDEVIYGKVGHYGSLVHISELEVV